MSKMNGDLRLYYTFTKNDTSKFNTFFLYLNVIRKCHCSSCPKLKNGTANSEFTVLFMTTTFLLLPIYAQTSEKCQIPFLVTKGGQIWMSISDLDPPPPLHMVSFVTFRKKRVLDCSRHHSLSFEFWRPFESVFRGPQYGFVQNKCGCKSQQGGIF